MAITLVRKPVELPGFALNSRYDMLDALDALEVDGWRGQINRTDSDGWRLELNRGGDVGSSNPVGKIEAAIGDVLVDDQGWRKLSADEVAASYDIVPAPPNQAPPPAPPAPSADTTDPAEAPETSTPATEDTEVTE